MKTWKQRRLWGFLVLLALAVFLLPGKAFAAISVESEKNYAASEGDVFTLTLASKTDVAVVGDENLVIWYGPNSAADAGKLDLSDGVTIESFEGRTWYFKVKSGKGTISFTWGSSNDTPPAAIEVTLKNGETKRIDDEYGYRYYLLHVTDPSAKYTFTSNNDVTDIKIIPHKVTTAAFPAADVEYKVDQGKSDTFLFKKGDYTICGTAFGKDVEFSIYREEWVGITKITPSKKGLIKGVMEETFEFTVNYEPKNANSIISVEDATYHHPETRIKLKKMKNGVATFTVDYKNYDTDLKSYVHVYSKADHKKGYNYVDFISEEGVTARAEKIIAPPAPTLYGKMNGTMKTITIPLEGRGNKYVAYYKKGSSWKKCGETSFNENGSYYVNCKGLKAGKTYTFRVYAYADGYKGGYLQVKGVTAYNVKPTKAKAKCTKAKFVKQEGKYDWFWTGYRWKKVEYANFTRLTVKVTYKLPKKAKGTYVTVNGVKRKSGKTFDVLVTGRSKAGKEGTVILQSVRESGNCLAYGPSVKVKYKMKAGK